MSSSCGEERRQSARRPGLAGQPGTERGRAEELSARLDAAWQRAQALMRASRRLARELEQAPPAASQKPLEWSPYARLRAQLATMPVIEQAKGIIMAQHCCDDEQAFQLLRSASQRSNRPVRELAAELVARTQHPSGEIQAEPDHG